MLSERDNQLHHVPGLSLVVKSIEKGGLYRCRWLKNAAEVFFFPKCQPSNFLQHSLLCSQQLFSSG